MPTTTPLTKNPAPVETAANAAIHLPLAFGRAALQAWIDLGSEAVRFASDRMRQDIKMQQALLACTNLSDLQKIQAEFVKSAQDQYAAETKRLFDVLKAASAAGGPDAAKGRRYDDVPV